MRAIRSTKAFVRSRRSFGKPSLASGCVPGYGFLLILPYCFTLQAVAFVRVTSSVSPSSPRTTWRWSLKARPLLYPRYGPYPGAEEMQHKARLL
jgi:hypothetical protein